MTVVTEFEKFRYKRVMLRLCVYEDIFQAKVDELIGYIKGS